MKTTRILPPINEVPRTAPLRLENAARLAYPDGSMTASGLRREAGRGRLVIEKTAGKDYTTLEAIEEMRKLCRVPAKAHIPCRAEPERRRVASSHARSTSSAMATSTLPRDALRVKLSKPT